MAQEDQKSGGGAWSGKRIGPLRPGCLPGPRIIRELVDAINSWLGLQVVQTDAETPSLVIGEGASVLAIPNAGQGGTSQPASTGGDRMAQITQLYGTNYLGVKFFNGSTVSGAQFNVAKSIPSQMPASAGAYTLAYSSDNARTSTNPGNPADVEAQTMTPPFTVGDTIWIAPVDHTGVSDGSGELLWQERNTEREWTFPSTT